MVVHTKLVLEVPDDDDALRASMEARLAYALMTIIGEGVTSDRYRANLLEARQHLLRAAKLFTAGELSEESAEVFKYLVEIDRRLKEFFGV